VVTPTAWRKPTPLLAVAELHDGVRGEAGERRGDIRTQSITSMSARRFGGKIGWVTLAPLMSASSPSAWSFSKA
jgi:hypothetical protein